ncbi:MAG: site-2 protease family protein [Patescibacteria group bacterium]|nr:site-2 protease family protein [Patescibacteria group bacterium]MDE1944072.1 site-2 protease family protein [Patescibacteria group bacterium]MDE1944733.1 site-2 protease family protein [Patescibacteria group bacterium]MDE2057277.1 site-2 protease family protein [Patescibacteria group bacterium]
MTIGLTLSLAILILSIIAHEVAHGYAADALGDPTARYSGRLTLNPLPHIDPVGSILIPGLLVLSGSPIFFGWAKPVPYNPDNLRGRWSETAVALAGIATNLALAIVFGLLVRFGAGVLSPLALSVAATIAFVNLFLGLFNLIPFPPLDGFTALRSALPWHAARSLRRFEMQVAQSGMLALILFLIIFSYLLAGPFSALVSRLFALLTGVSA